MSYGSSGLCHLTCGEGDLEKAHHLLNGSFSHDHFRVSASAAKVSLASFLGVFMMFGLGFSSFFRMHELWRRSRREATEPWERLLYLHKAAGREMLPVVCTALCYYLLMTSTLVPLREFGVFIGTSMLFAVLFAVLCFVPLLLIHEESLRPCLRRRPKVALVLEPSQLKPNWQLLASKIMVILRRPKPLLGGTALVVFICFVAALAVTASQPYPALPEVFPPDHHREAGRPLLQGFAPASPAEQAAPQTTRMCQPGRNLSSCALHWCDLASTPNNNLSAWPTSQAAPCSCYGPSGLATSCSNITVSLHVTGSRATALSQEEVLPQVQAYLQQHFSDSESMETASVSSRRLQSVVLEEPQKHFVFVDVSFGVPSNQKLITHNSYTLKCSLSLIFTLLFKNKKGNSVQFNSTMII